jgi:hypothetical protein
MKYSWRGWLSGSSFLIRMNAHTANQIETAQKWRLIRDDEVKVYLDKLLAVATGTLAITVTFRNSIAANADHLWLLKVAWALISLSIVSALRLYLGKVLAIQKALKRAMDEGELKDANVHWLTEHITWPIARVAFPAGLICLTIFGMLNLDGDRKASLPEVAPVVAPG